MHTSPPQIMDHLKALVTRACVDLFVSHAPGLDPREMADTAQPILHGDWVMSIMGFGGETMRGALCLFVSRSAARVLLPPGLSEDEMGGIDETDLVRDAVGEFSNMIVGRVKNQLLERGIVLVLAIPGTAVASDVCLPKSRPTAVWLELKTMADPVYVQIEAAVSADFRLPSIAPVFAVLGEGELMTF